MFTDRDLADWQTSLSGKGISFEISRKNLKGLFDRLKSAETILDYATHESDCILSFWEAGEPTKDGGYRTKFKGKWYQSRPINKEPKCDCGLDQALEAYCKTAGK